MKNILLLTALAFASVATATAQTDLYCTPDWFCPDVDGGTTIQYTLQEAATVSVEVVDSFSGQRIRLLVTGEAQAAGSHQVFWDGRNEQGDVLDVQPFEVRLDIDGARADDTYGAINCGDDLGTPVREKAGDRDVTLGFWVSLVDAPDAVLAIYGADGVTVVDTLYSGPAHQLLGIIWPPNLAPGAPLPAGDYVCRLTSSVYSEDLSFYMDPVEPAGMTVFVTDGDDSVVEGLALVDLAQVYGPLQEARIQFDRALSAPELEYLLGGGLRFDGQMENAGPGSFVVTPDSSAILITEFDPLLPWNETLGVAFFNNIGMLTPGTAAFRIGYHHTGVTGLSVECNSLGVTDPDDWQVEWPYNLDPPCPNPAAPGSTVNFGIGIPFDEFMIVRVYDEFGNSVRTLLQDWLDDGYRPLAWDLADDQGVPVPDGMYHLAWVRYDDDTSRYVVVASGEIQVWSQVGIDDDGPIAAAAPRLLANHPNPFNPRTTIVFELPEAEAVRLRVFDLAGSLVSVLIDGEIREAGRHEAVWDGRDGGGRQAASGTYFYRFEAGRISETRSMVLLK